MAVVSHRPVCSTTIYSEQISKPKAVVRCKTKKKYKNILRKCSVFNFRAIMLKCFKRKRTGEEKKVDWEREKERQRRTIGEGRKKRKAKLPQAKILVMALLTYKHRKCRVGERRCKLRVHVCIKTN